MAIQGKDIEKTTSYSKTQISPIFIKDEKYQEPTYSITTGYDGTVSVYIREVLTGTLTGERIYVNPQTSFSHDLDGGEVISLTTLSGAAIDIELVSGDVIMTRLKDFVGTIKIGLPKGIQATLKIKGKLPNTPVYFVKLTPTS